jgi:acyl carrier protein
LYLPLINGRSVELLSEEEGIESLARALSEEREYSLVKITPAHLEILEHQFGDREVKSGARTLVIGGEELRSGRLKYWREKAKGTRLINEYGPTETVVGCCVYEVNGNEEGYESAPIGRPIANMQMYILDQSQNPAPVGVKGEICISGKGVARGYVGSPELTGEKFIPNPFSGKVGERWYRTGDLGRYREDSNIEFLGRADDQVKIRGYRIELGEIVAVLNEHRSVKQSLVIAREDETGGRRLIGYVVGEEGAKSAELKRHVGERVPEYMVPEAIVLLEEFPLTTNGKIDRKRLPSAGEPDRQMEQAYAAPRTPMEEMVTGIFGETLKLDRVGIRDNFFDLGGHSLLAIQVISRVRNAFGVEIGVRSLFDAPTAEGLSSKIEEAMRAGEKAKTPPLISVEPEGERPRRAPLSFAQQRLWFIDQLNPGSAVYNIPGAVRLEGDLDIDALERVINEIIRRHEALRTRFEVNGGEPSQVIDAWTPRKLEIVDLTTLSSEAMEEEVARRAREEAETGFDLSQGPLLRVKVLKLKDADHVLLYTMHHIASDGWSAGIMISEVETLYKAFSMGEESPLDELPIQYADFAIWQRSWLQGEMLENQLAYWRRQLAGQLPALELPADRPRPARPSYRGAQHWLLLPTALSDSLKALSLKRHSTLFMTLMAAFKTLLYYLTRQTDICVGTDIANRNHAETEKLIGFFVNQLALRTRLSPSLNFEELLRRVREVTLEAFARQDLPFEKLVEALNPDRDESHTPLFQVKMTLQNASDEQVSLPGLTLSSLGTAISATKHDLLLDLIDTKDGIGASLQYNTDLFEEHTPARILRRFHALLERIVERPDAKLQELVESLIDEDEREHLEEKSELENVRLSKLKNIKRRTIREINAATEQ